MYYTLSPILWEPLFQYHLCYFDALIKAHLKNSGLAYYIEWCSSRLKIWPSNLLKLHREDSPSLLLYQYLPLYHGEMSWPEKPSMVWRSESEGVEGSGVDTISHNSYKTNYCSSTRAHIHVWPILIVLSSSVGCKVISMQTSHPAQYWSG